MTSSYLGVTAHGWKSPFKGEQEIKDYMKLNVPREVLKLDPLDYRLKKENDYLSISTVACDILLTPISVECIFSSVEVAKGNQLQDMNLEKELFLQNNTCCHMDIHYGWLRLK